MKRINRSSNWLTVSEIYEIHQLKLWTNLGKCEEVEKEFQNSLLKAIQLNYPIPAVYVQTVIDTTSFKKHITILNGEKIILSIVDFVENQLDVAKTSYTQEEHNHFWKYKVNFEYLPKNLLPEDLENIHSFYQQLS